MSAPWKGILIGACTMVVVAVLIAGQEYGFLERARLMREHDVFMTVTTLGVIPSLASGAALGALAQRLTRFRFVLLAAFAMAVVAILGILTAPKYIPIAAAPVLAAACVLTRWTARGADGAPRAKDPLTSAWKGAYLGLANVVTIGIAFGLALAAGGPHAHFEVLSVNFNGPALELTLTIVFVGLIPALAIGGALGTLAGQLAAHGRLARIAIVACIAVSIASLVGLGVGAGVRTLLCSVPSVAAAVVLERWTRGARPQEGGSR